ncbi:E1 ubiquitin-activating protein aos1, partial [Friedmanniomyces endolithicus]
LSADEIALYDRQLRLWGAEAQKRIRSANILLVSLRALGTEIAKNLTLAGINSLTIIDDEPVSEEDLGSQYFVREEDIGKPRAEAAIPRIRDLNPAVTIRSGGPLAALLAQDQTFYAPYTCVIATDHDLLTLSQINTTARFATSPFYAAAIHGFYGYIFADLLTHTFAIEREKSNIPTAI